MCLFVFVAEINESDCRVGRGCVFLNITNRRGTVVILELLDVHLEYSELSTELSKPRVSLLTP